MDDFPSLPKRYIRKLYAKYELLASGLKYVEKPSLKIKIFLSTLTMVTKRAG